jgi:hypothetical protein
MWASKNEKRENSAWGTSGGLIKIHENMDFVRIQIEKRFYRRLEETAKRLEITPDKLRYYQ